MQTIQINDLEYQQSQWRHVYPTNAERVSKVSTSEWDASVCDDDDDDDGVRLQTNATI